MIFFLFDFCIIIVILDRRLILDVIKKIKLWQNTKKKQDQVLGISIQTETSTFLNKKKLKVGAIQKVVVRRGGITDSYCCLNLDLRAVLFLRFLFFIYIFFMQVRVKTDLYQNSSYLAHLLEHCVFSNQPSISNYFQIDQGVEGTSWINYTTFSLRADQDPQFFINHLMQPLDTRVIRNAQKLIKQEVREDFRSTGDLLINKVGKELYGKDFRRYAES